mmetsp:Transcript_16808/g.28513  ORF Transcript_16808/g.28513 Transcript_16808/m.28513 type:complete len:354 (-) Transcript_16808:1414-2475(-)
MAFVCRHKDLLAIAWVIAIFLCLNVLFYWLGNRYPSGYDDFLTNTEVKPIVNAGRSPYYYSSDGRRKMSESNVTIIGIGKNLGRTLSPILNQLDALSGRFSNSHVYLVFDGSASIETKIILQRWHNQSGYNHTVIYQEELEINSHTTMFASEYNHDRSTREGRIALARNVGLQIMRKQPRFMANYVIQLDLDILGWDMYGIEDSFGQTSQWDAVCSNGIMMHGLYRDTYAFRMSSNGINTNHHLSGTDHELYNISKTQRIRNRRQMLRSKYHVHELMESTPQSKTAFVKKKSNLLYSDSCFGGLAIYKSEFIEGCTYSERHRDPPYIQDCEHVVFHQCLKDKHNATIATNFNM